MRSVGMYDEKCGLSVQNVEGERPFFIAKNRAVISLKFENSYKTGQ